MLCETMKGWNMYDLSVVCPMYADGITIIATYSTTVKNLLKVVQEFASKWRLQFNPKKCSYMTFSRNATPKNVDQVGWQKNKSYIHYNAFWYRCRYRRTGGAGNGPERKELLLCNTQSWQER